MKPASYFIPPSFFRQITRSSSSFFFLHQVFLNLPLEHFIYPLWSFFFHCQNYSSITSSLYYCRNYLIFLRYSHLIPINHPSAYNIYVLQNSSIVYRIHIHFNECFTQIIVWCKLNYFLEIKYTEKGTKKCNIILFNSTIPKLAHHSFWNWSTIPKLN